MSALFLYEPRMLHRMAVTNVIEEQQHRVQSYQLLSSLIEHLNESTKDNKIALIGVGGSGESFFELLKVIRRMRALRVRVLAWVPIEYRWVSQLLAALHVSVVLHDDELAPAFSAALAKLLEANPAASRQSKPLNPVRRLTLTELDILLQFASGFTSREMAEQRGCNHKTIFSWKHNICEALELTSHSEWLDMLTEMTQLSSLYRQG